MISMLLSLLLSIDLLSNIYNVSSSHHYLMMKASELRIVTVVELNNGRITME
jgi:hypothetical protein